MKDAEFCGYPENGYTITEDDAAAIKKGANFKMFPEGFPYVALYARDSVDIDCIENHFSTSFDIVSISDIFPHDL